MEHLSDPEVSIKIIIIPEWILPIVICYQPEVLEPIFG